MGCLGWDLFGSVSESFLAKLILLTPLSQNWTLICMFRPFLNKSLGLFKDDYFPIFVKAVRVLKAFHLSCWSGLNKHIFILLQQQYVIFMLYWAMLEFTASNYNQHIFNIMSCPSQKKSKSKNLLNTRGI